MGRMQFLYVKAAGTCSDHWALKGQYLLNAKFLYILGFILVPLLVNLYNDKCLKQYCC
jgi:hypothetical protein